MIIGINALNIKSGGGTSHIENILINLNREFLKKEKINKIILWCNPYLYSYLIKFKLYKKNITIIKIKDNLLFNILWKLYFLYKNLKKYNCDVLYSLDGIVLRKFEKVVIIYQNLLPFSNFEILRYGLSLQTIKLIFLRYIYYISKNNANGVIYLNKYGKIKIENQIGKSKNFSIIPHGVSNEYIYNFKRKLINKNSIINIIYISPIDLYKHQWNVTKSVELLIKENFKIKLHIVGIYSNKKAKNLFLKSYNELNSLKKNSVIYYGHLKKKKIVNLLKKMDIFLFASSCESFGITLLEGAANKLPIFSSNMSGIPSTLGKKNIYFNPLDYLNIYKQLKKNLENLNNMKTESNYKEILSKYNWKKSSFSTFNFIIKMFKKKHEKSKKNYLISSDMKNKLFLFIRKNIFSLLYLNSSFSVIFIFILLYFLSSAKYSVDFLIISSLMVVITKIFSSNIKNIAVIDKNVSLIKYHFKFRLFISLLIITFFFVTKKYFIDYEDSTLYFCIIIFILSFWIYELRIAFNEIKKIKNDSFLALYSVFFLYLIFLILLYLINDRIALLIFLILTSLKNILFSSFFFIRDKNFEEKKEKYTNEKYIQFTNLAFFSFLFLTLAIFILRFFLNKEFDDDFVSDVLFSIAISNLPASLINTTFGSSYLNRDVSLPIFFKYLFKFYVLLLLISIFFLITNFYPSHKNFLKILSYSLIGGFFMFFAEIIRILNLAILRNRRSVFFRDIIFSLIIFLDLFLCFFFKKVYLLYFSYSFFAIIIYCFYYKLDAFNKKL